MEDLIRREDALAILDLAEHDAEERDWRSGANEIARLIQRVRSIAASPEVAALIRDGWRDDPESSEAWCAGNDYALTRLCKVLGVDPDKVDWDGSDGSRDEEADALIWRILHANDDDDGRSPAIREAEARGMERAAVIADRHLSKVEINEPLWHEGQDWAAESIALAIRAEVPK